MNSRQYFGTALLQTHKQVTEHFLIVRENPGEQIDIETADQPAEEAKTLAVRLTIQWEAAMQWSQSNDDDPDSDVHRINSTTDLDRPFVLPADVCPDRGGSHSSGDTETPNSVTFPVTTYGTQNLVQ
jgi:hypothetical protein